MEPGEFGGTIGRYHHEAEPWWPEPVRARAGAPNVLLVVLDDVGFAQLGCFGSDIDTPTFDRLAAGGLRYANFHTTALCSPTRNALKTGRNHHTTNTGSIMESSTAFSCSTPSTTSTLRSGTRRSTSRCSATARSIATAGSRGPSTAPPGRPAGYRR